MKTFHIFAGGELGDTSFIDISSGDFVICADSGIVRAERLGVRPKLIVGDFDSYTGDLPADTEIHRSVPEKDDTDTMLALKLAIERGAEKVMIYGAFGGRFDHTVANLQTLAYAQAHGCEAVLADGDNTVYLYGTGEYSFPRSEDAYFSFFAYTPEVRVTLKGVKYPLDNSAVASTFPIGVSNEITGSEAVLTIHEGRALVVISKKISPNCSL